MLLLLASAGAAGMDAGALSAALYGDREHLVTVRAEMSRLRRSLGGLLLARPYRLAPHVDVVLPDLAASTFVRGPTAPGVRALRRCSPPGPAGRRATHLQPLPGGRWSRG